MLEGFLQLFSRRPLGQVLLDIADVLIVAYVIYRALLVVRGTRAMQMGLGLGLIVLGYVVARWAGLVTLFNVLSTLLSSLFVLVVVVFQNDIRRGLMRVGSGALVGGLSRQQETRVIDEIVAAATELARHRMGAIICLEQEANLDEFANAQGTTIDANVQRDLLVSLFVAEGVNKLHDGAIIIRNLRIAKAGVFFPLPDTKVLDKSMGTRHRAAIGITDETDAVVVVVSEERGTISFFFNGNIIPNVDGVALKEALAGLFGKKPQKKKSVQSARGPEKSLKSPPARTSVVPVSTGKTPLPGSIPPVGKTPMPGSLMAIPKPSRAPAPTPMPGTLKAPQLPLTIPAPEESVPASLVASVELSRPMKKMDLIVKGPPSADDVAPVSTKAPAQDSTEGNG
jgi:diadenylate cyclase